MKLFKVLGTDWDFDDCIFLKVARDKESLIAELEDDSLYCFNLVEISEVDGYKVKLERIDD